MNPSIAKHARLIRTLKRAGFLPHRKYPNMMIRDNKRGTILIFEKLDIGRYNLYTGTSGPAWFDIDAEAVEKKV